MKRCIALLLVFSLCCALCPAVRADSSTDCGAKLLAITFDDGPGRYTGALLDALAERNVKATFFVAGCNAVNYPEILGRIVDEGHQLASHTYNHKNLNTLSSDAIISEMSRTQELITNAGGSENAYIRAPYGNSNDKVLAVASVPFIYWSIDPNDWKYRNAKTVENHIVSHSYDGAIILCHDPYYSTVQGAVAAIDRLLEQGYEFVTVEELLLRRGITPEPGVVYYDAKNTGINLPAEYADPQYYDETKVASHWGFAALKISFDNGYMNRSESGEWLPNHYMTRADFVTALAKYNGISAEYEPLKNNYYTDVGSDSESFPFIAWANDTGLMVGNDSGQFNPNDILTREQMAVVIAKYLSIKNISPTVSDINKFTDVKRISLWAVDSIGKCVSAGLLQGDGVRFLPKQRITRAQVAVLLYNLNQY